MKTATSFTQPLRQIFRDVPLQLRHNRWWISAVAIVLLILTLIVVHLHRNTHIIVTELFEDPVEFGILPQHVGLYSYASATTLVVAGAIMLFAVWSALDVVRDVKALLFVLGAILLWLGLDDVFMIHEWVGLRLAWLIQSENVPHDRQWLESAVFATYGVTFGAILIYFRKLLLQTPWILLILSCTGLALSVILDIQLFLPFIPSPSNGTQALTLVVIEDMSKLAGGAFALAYSVRLSGQTVRGSYATLR